MKNVKSPLEKQAVEKAAVEKVASQPVELEKTAIDWKNLGNSAQNVGKVMGTSALGTIGAVGAAALANHAYGAIGRWADKPKFEQAFQRAIQMDPVLQGMYAENPTQLRQYLDLVIEASPNIAKNPLVLSNYLRYLVDYQGSMNFKAYRELLDLESTSLRNRESSRPLTGIAQKAMLEGTIKNILGNPKGKGAGKEDLNV